MTTGRSCRNRRLAAGRELPRALASALPRSPRVDAEPAPRRARGRWRAPRRGHLAHRERGETVGDRDERERRCEHEPARARPHAERQQEPRDDHHGGDTPRDVRRQRRDVERLAPVAAEVGDAEPVVSDPLVGVRQSPRHEAEDGERRRDAQDLETQHRKRRVEPVRSRSQSGFTLGSLARARRRSGPSPLGGRAGACDTRRRARLGG